jgi:hypothetical protein
MNNAELELVLYRILSGKLYFYYKNEKYELKQISNTLRYEASLLYNKIINEEKYNDWIREENMISIMISLGLWTKETDTIINQLEKRIDNFKVELFQNFMSTSKIPSIKKNLNSAKNQLNRILNIKNDFFTNTLEGYASSLKHEYLICSTLVKNSKRVFNHEDNSLSSYTEFNDLVNEINKYSLKLEDIKELARNSIWRSYWNSNKENIFQSSVSEWTDDQRTIVNMSRMYDSVYDHPESPNEKIIEDDDMLDGWMIIQKRKMEKIKNQKTIDDINPNLKNAQEVFLFGRNQQDVENIIGLNDQESMGRFKEKIGAINARGKLEDGQLPDIQRDLFIQSNEMRKNRK